MANPNLALLVGMAQAMGPLCDRVVFVGGCATGLLINDPALLHVRATEDVDAIVEVASLVGYHALARELMQRGFKQTMADNTPPFRWYWQRMQLDLVPLDEKVLGFANRWYRPGFDVAVQTEVALGMALRHLSAPYFLATKFEAFGDRGNNDVYASHDLEDILTVVEGRAELVEELANASADVRTYVATCIAQLLNHSDFDNALGGLLSQPSREPLVRARLQQLTQKRAA
jgi:predicted nucleotidyltransferase